MDHPVPPPPPPPLHHTQTSTKYLPVFSVFEMFAVSDALLLGQVLQIEIAAI